MVLVRGTIHLYYKALEACRSCLDVNLDHTCLHPVTSRHKLGYDFAMPYDAAESHPFSSEHLWLKLACQLLGIAMGMQLLLALANIIVRYLARLVTVGYAMSVEGIPI